LQDFCDEIKNLRFTNIEKEKAADTTNISKILDNSQSNNDLQNGLNEISSMPSYTITIEHNNSVSENDNNASKNTKLTKLNQNAKEKNVSPFSMNKKNKKQTAKSTKQRPLSINIAETKSTNLLKENDNEIFIDQIMNLNVDNKGEMINLIESLMGKDESEINSKHFHNMDDHSKNDEKKSRKHNKKGQLINIFCIIFSFLNTNILCK